MASFIYFCTMNYTFNQLHQLDDGEFQDFIKRVSDDTLKGLFKSYKELLKQLNTYEGEIVEERLSLLENEYGSRYPKDDTARLS